VASLAPAYTPRRPSETVLYQLVRANLETFLAHSREHYEGGLPHYVEREQHGYLKCGQFSEGFTRAHCDSCGHDLLVAFSCGSRSICPSCTGRRMANTAAFLVDRVVPDVPLRQYVLTLPYELRKLVAFKADVLTAVARIFVESVFANCRIRAKRNGIEAPQCGAVNFVQRFGSLNLHVHYHLMALDGVFVRDAQSRVVFHPSPPPTPADLDASVERTARRVIAWLRRHGHVDDAPLQARSNEPPTRTALDACAAIAMGRGNVATLPRDGTEQDHAHGEHDDQCHKPALAVERDGFNLHAAVRIEAGDDFGRERLLRYGARPPLSLERLRRLPGGRAGAARFARGRGPDRDLKHLGQERRSDLSRQRRRDGGRCHTHRSVLRARRLGAGRGPEGITDLLDEFQHGLRFHERDLRALRQTRAHASLDGNQQVDCHHGVDAQIGEPIGVLDAVWSLANQLGDRGDHRLPERDSRHVALLME
jgi:hypothetical protein